jgi:hypothetical protein
MAVERFNGGTPVTDDARGDAANLPPWEDAAAAYAAQSTMTCDHGHLLWQSCRQCGVGEYIPPAGPRT